MSLPSERVAPHPLEFNYPPVCLWAAFDCHGLEMRCLPSLPCILKCPSAMWMLGKVYVVATGLN